MHTIRKLHIQTLRTSSHNRSHARKRHYALSCIPCMHVCAYVRACSRTMIFIIGQRNVEKWHRWLIFVRNGVRIVYWYYRCLGNRCVSVFSCVSSGPATVARVRENCRKTDPTGIVGAGKCGPELRLQAWGIFETSTKAAEMRYAFRAASTTRREKKIL